MAPDMIKAIIFDIGSTYLEGSCAKFMRRANEFLGVKAPSPSVDEVTFSSDLNSGRISPDAFFRGLFNVKMSDRQLKEIKRIWTTTWSLTPEMEKLVRGLKNRYLIAVLSNSDPLNAEKFRSEGWYDPFDRLILSHELGILKPNPEIYKIALKRIGLPAENCLFIDDQEKVLVPARKLGMKTILFKSIDQLKRELHDLGVEF